MHFSKLMWVRGSDVHLSGSRSKQNAHSCFIFIGYKRILIFLSSLMLIKVNVNVTITTDTSGCKLPLGRVLQYIPLLGSVLCFVTFLYPDFLQKTAFSHWSGAGLTKMAEYTDKLPSTPQLSLLQPTTAQFSLVKTSSVQYSPVQPSTAHHSPVQSSAAQYNPVQPTTAHCSPVQPSSSKLRPVQPGTVHYSLVQPITAQYSTLQPSTIH